MAEGIFIQISVEELRSLIKEEVSNSLSGMVSTIPDNKAKEIMNLKEAALYLSIPEDSLYGMVSARTIPHYKIGKRLQFRKVELDEWRNSKKRVTKKNYDL